MRKESPAPPAEARRLRQLGAAPFLGAAAFANLLALDRLAGEDAPRSVGFVRLGLAALVLAVGAVELFRGSSRERLLGREGLALLAAIAAFGLGLVELGLLPLALLSRIGLDADALRAAHASGFETAASIVLAACLARGAAATLAYAARADLDARDRARATSARRLGEGGDEEIVPSAALAEGASVRLLEGERAPVDLELLGSARVALLGAAGPCSSAELHRGARLDAGAVLLSGEVKGRVVRDRAIVAAAMDAEVRRALSQIDACAARPRPFSWSAIAARALLISALCASAFAALLHATVDDLGRGGPLSVLAAIAVLAGSSTAAFSLAAPIARGIAVLRAREDAVVVKDVAALERLADVDFACFDEPAAAAGGAPHALWDRGVGCRLLSEEPPLATASVAHRLGIPCSAGLSAAGKARAVEEITRAGGRVLVVSRGAATIPLSGTAALTVAIVKGAPPSDVDAPIVVNGGPPRLPALLDRSRTLCRRLRENAAITTVYNAAVIPAAVLGLLSPIQAAGLTLLEAALVLGNTARLFGAQRPAASIVDWPSQEPAARATIRVS